MSYTALYRKWRPQTFEDVKGQDPIVTTLKNQVCSGRIGHAYLFCGTRGTGKTSVAKIFARAVNCEAPVNGSPCGKCASCLQIAAGNSLNVMEIDAASNNGVENIREIREQVQYPPTEGKYRVYIIDEVHMLSTGGLQRAFKNPGGASVLRYLYSGDDRGAPDPDHGIIPVPKIRFPENYGGYDHGALKRADGSGTDAGGGTGAPLSGEGGRRLHAGCFKPSGSVRRVPFRRNPNL